MLREEILKEEDAKIIATLIEAAEKGLTPIEREIYSIVRWINDYVSEHHLASLVVGVSGGIDSAVVERLCEKTGLPVYTVNLPMYFTTGSPCPSSQRAYELCKDRPENVHYFVKTIAGIVGAYKDEGIGSTQLTEGNLRARIRANILYDFAAKNSGIVVGTGNKDEDTIGYMTKGGDSLVDICPLSAIHKSSVYAMGKILEVPQSILDAAPTAELWDGQTDEGELGLTYDQVEWAIKILEGNDYICFDAKNREILDKVHKMIKKNAHKLSYPPIYQPKYI